MAVAIVSVLTLPSGGAAQSVPFPVTIQGPSSPLEDVRIHFAAVLPDRPVRVDPQGMSPSAASNEGGALPVVWEPPVTLVWDFGDGTPPVEVREYTSVTHVWPDDGDYTVTLSSPPPPRTRRTIRWSTAGTSETARPLRAPRQVQGLFERLGWSRNAGGGP